MEPAAGTAADTGPAAETASPPKESTTPPKEATTPPRESTTPAKSAATEKAQDNKTTSNPRAPESGSDVAGRAPSGSGAASRVPMHMPEPPTKPSPATVRRTRAVQGRAGRTATAQGDLPAGGTQVGDAREAVTEPDAEALARAQAALIAAVKAEPSQEIVALCERIREVIRNKRPPDEDALMAAEPEGEALNAGNELNTTVQGETEKVQENYGPMEAAPEPGAPKQGQDLPPQPPAVRTADVNAGAAVPDAIPAENVSLEKDAEASRQRAQQAGLDSPAAQLVQTGPIGEARAARGELDQVAQEGPAQVLARQQDALAQAEGNMAALQYQALTALEASRAGAAEGNTARQGGMVGTEEQMRNGAATAAQTIFTDARLQVSVMLKDLPKTAMENWDAAKELLATKFKADLKPVQDRVDERHSGVGGFFVSGWDALTGLPDWAEEGYTKAETDFAEGVIAKLTEISTHVNAVILACDQIIATARTRITKIFADLPDNLRAWAAGEQARFDGQLDALHAQVTTTRNNFNRDLVRSSAQAVDDVRVEVAALRAKAAGIIGRFVDAVNRFLEDPAKFLIDGLLNLLGIAPPAFWALVAKIKKVIGDIADDPLRFANNLMAGLAQGFGRFFDNFPKHLLHGFLDWLLGGIKGVQIPRELSLRGIIGFFLQIMGITWPNIRKILVRLVGPKNVALLEKVYSIVADLMERGIDGIYEMIKDKLDPQGVIDQIIQLAVDFLSEAIIKQVTVRVIALFNPAGAILQAIEAIYRVLKWIFQNAGRIFTLVDTVVSGIADILAGNVGAVAVAVEKALVQLIAPVLAFIADYLSLGDLPAAVAEKVESMREWVLGMIERALAWVIEKGKALLAALGIGKKDEAEAGAGEESVGEEMAFTAGGEQHRLWIDVSGDEATFMVASTRQSLMTFLTGKKVGDAVTNDSTGTLGNLVKSALDLLKKGDVIADRVVRNLSQTHGTPAATSPPPAPQQQKQLTQNEQQLVPILIQIFNQVGGSYKIFEVIGKPVDPILQSKKLPDGYAEDDPRLPEGPGEPRFYGLKRIGVAGSPSEYPRVSVNPSGLIYIGLGPHRYDLDLVDRYRQAIQTAKSRHPVEGNPLGSISQLRKYWAGDATYLDARARGHRREMEEIIEVVNAGKYTLLAVQIYLSTGAFADYVVKIDGKVSLVEVKSWRDINLTMGSKDALRFLTQMKRYVDEAAKMNAQVGAGVEVYDVQLHFDGKPVHLNQLNQLINLVKIHAATKKPKVEVTETGLT
ncbi:hypothetical protein ACQP2E_12315 [Actinoplanes sp. CA-015351]|uniref:hypothetical protein n=1 Tax=Actinoplanes sp. CA-015351 TaxID=3239897 RepID=UPI003D96F74E